MERTLCRLCLDRGGSFMNIFAENSEPEFVVRETVQDLLQIEAAKEEGYPWLICIPCLDKLTEFRLFKNRAIESKHIYELRVQGKKISSTKFLGSTQGLLKRIVANEKTKVYNGHIVTGSESGEILPSGLPYVQEKEVEIKSEPLWMEGSTSDEIFKKSFASDAEEFKTEDCFTRKIVSLGGYIPVNLLSTAVGNEPFINDQELEEHEGISDELLIPEVQLELGHPGSSKEQYIENDEIDCIEIPLNSHKSRPRKERSKTFPCSNCDKKFSDKWGLRRHLVFHTKERPFQCNLCHKKFSRKDRLFEHFRKAEHGDPEDPLKCSDHKNIGIHKQTSCPSHPGPSKESFIEDDKIACIEIPLNSCKSRPRKERKKIFPCSNCDKWFSDMWSLRRHSVFHTKERPFECSLCHKKFSRKDRLSQHIQKAEHGKSSEDPSKCSDHKNKGIHKQTSFPNHTGPSKKSYSENDKTLWTEISLNSDKNNCKKGRRKAFLCSSCDKTFSDMWALRRHLVTHTKEQPFECNLCHKKFSRKDRLSEHVQHAEHGQL